MYLHSLSYIYIYAYLYVYVQEKARDAITHSTDASSTTGVEDNPTSPVPAKSPQDKQPPPKPEPLAAAAATVGDREEGEGEKGITFGCINLQNLSISDPGSLGWIKHLPIKKDVLIQEGC